MRILVVEPGKKPYLKDIENTLSAMQREVGGYIEPVYLYDDGSVIICNADGKLSGLPFNRALRSPASNKVKDVLVGTFFVVGTNGEEFDSISDAAVERYNRAFETPERFSKTSDGRIVVLPII